MSTAGFTPAGAPPAPPVGLPTPLILGATWSATRTCLGCVVDWNTAGPCWICGVPGARLDLLPAAERAEHVMAGHAVLCPSGGDGGTCPI